MKKKKPKTAAKPSGRAYSMSWLLNAKHEPVVESKLAEGWVGSDMVLVINGLRSEDGLRLSAAIMGVDGRSKGPLHPGAMTGLWALTARALSDLEEIPEDLRAILSMAYLAFKSREERLMEKETKT